MGLYCCAFLKLRANIVVFFVKILLKFPKIVVIMKKVAKNETTHACVSRCSRKIFVFYIK